MLIRLDVRNDEGQGLAVGGGASGKPDERTGLFVVNVGSADRFKLGLATLL